MKLTQQQKDRYFTSPNHCPFCERRYPRQTESVHHGIVEFVYWVCDNGECDGKWVEQFELTDIWEDDSVSDSN